MSDTEPATVTLSCPEPGCDWEVTAPGKGPGSAPFRLGTHRARRHGYRKGDGRRPKLTGDPEATSVRSLIGDAVGEVGRKSNKAPTEEELTRAGARLLGSASVVAACWAAETDPNVADDDEATREAIVNYLSLKPAQAREIASPMAHYFAQTKLNARYGRAIVDNVDLASAAAESANYGHHWWRYLRARRIRARIAAGQTQVIVAEPLSVVREPAPGPAAPPPGGTTNPPPMAGVVASGQWQTPQNGATPAAGAA